MIEWVINHWFLWVVIVLTIIKVFRDEKHLNEGKREPVYTLWQLKF